MSDELNGAIILLLSLIDVIGWWTTLFIPTLSINLGNILSLTVWSVAAILLFFLVWLPLMIAGFFFLMLAIFD